MSSWAELCSTSDMNGYDVQSSNPQLEALKKENEERRNKDFQRQQKFFKEQEERRKQRQQQQQPQQQRQQQPQQQRQQQPQQQQNYIKEGAIFKATASIDGDGNPYFSGEGNKLLNLKLFDSNNRVINHQNSNIRFCSILWNNVFDENSEFEVKIKSINNKGKLDIKCSYTEHLPKLAEGCYHINDLRKGNLVKGFVSGFHKKNHYVSPTNVYIPDGTKTDFNIFNFPLHLENGSYLDNLIITREPNEVKGVIRFPLKLILPKPILALDMNGLLCKREYNKNGTVTTTLYDNYENFLRWCTERFYVCLTTCADRKDINYDDVDDLIDLGVISGFKPDGDNKSRYNPQKPLFRKDMNTIKDYLSGIYLGPTDENKNLTALTKLLVIEDANGDEKIEKLPFGSAIYLPNHDENSLLEGSPIYEILEKYMDSENVQETTLNILQKEPSFYKFLPINVLDSHNVFPEIPFERTCAAYLKEKNFRQMLNSEINSEIQTYCVTEKSDGVRFFLVFFEGKLFLVDRTNTRYEVSINSMSYITDGTIFDGELVEQILDGKRQLSYLVFDVINLNTNDLMSSTSSTSSVSTKTDVSQLNLDQRLSLVRFYDGFDLQFVDKIPSFEEFKNFKLKVKDLYNLQNVKDLINSIETNNGKYFYQSKDGSKTEVDGVMITNQNDPKEIFKWKYPDKLTVDYRLTRENFLSPDTNKNLSLRGSDDSFQYELHHNSNIHKEIDSYFRLDANRDGVIVECNNSHILRVRYDKKNANYLETANEIQEVIKSNFSVEKLLTKPLSVNAPAFEFKL